MIIIGHLGKANLHKNLAVNWRLERVGATLSGLWVFDVAIIPKSKEMISCTGAVCGYVSCMDWQQLVALAIVATAAGLLVRSRFSRRKFSFERDTHCGCAATGSSAQKNSIVFRARKGQRPEVLVKMR
jgi:hypothetical protein